ncbi:MAG TPA: asparagine synthase (glutamine-hydrolyzing) [Planctomycetota bacterium]|nr:asparagine synthase (glutamine-hydrolyzing) [Planctomycetota bacterium]
MCGLAGVAGDPSAEAAERVVRALAALARRGPDGSGLLAVGDAILGHRRLAVVDPSDAGAQPCVDAARRRAAVVNGQFHDHEAVRRELVADGFRPRGRGDSELLLPLHRRHGAEVVRRLRGPFAFALYDADARTLLLARDRFGGRPLFYALRDGALWFASEAAALAAAVGARPRRDLVPTLLRCGYVPAPASAFEGISALGAGERLTWRPGDAAPQVERWWTPPTPDGDDARGAADVDAALAAGLEEAVGLRLAADRPIGLLLSGGLDSTAILAAAAARGTAPTCFTARFRDARLDESEAAARTAARFGAPHRAVDVEPGVADALDDVVRAGDLHADPSTLALAALCREVRRDAVVLLTGDGGDEILLGYERQRAAAFGGLPLGALAAAARLGVVRSRRGAKAAAAAGLPARRAYAELSAVAGEPELRRFVRPEALSAVDPLAAQYDVLPRLDDALADVGRLDLVSYLPGDLAVKADRAAAACGIECWAPFLDPTFAETLLAFPARLRASRRRGKLPLRRFLAARGAGDVARRRKRGFGVPLRAWLTTGPLRDVARAALHDVRAPFDGVLRGDSGAALWTAFERGEPLELAVYACVVAALHADVFGG